MYIYFQFHVTKFYDIINDIEVGYTKIGQLEVIRTFLEIFHSNCIVIRYIRMNRVSYDIINDIKVG